MRSITGISHLTIAVDNPSDATADYEHLLGLASHAMATGTHRLHAGNVALVFRQTVEGDTPGLCGITFRTGDLPRACNELARCGVPTTDAFDPGDGRVLSPAATNGLPLALIEGSACPADAAMGVVLDHVVIRSRNPERAVALYGGRLGLDMRLDRTNPAWDARLMFFRCGDLVVEIVHVLSQGQSDAPDTFGGLSWRMPDIDAAHARLEVAGFALSPVRGGRRLGSRVCTVRNRTGGVPTILLGVAPRDGNAAAR